MIQRGCNISTKHKMTKNKEYDPNEVDKVQARNEKLDEKHKLEAKYRKQANIKKRTNDKEERLEVERDIIKRYGSKEVKEEHLNKKDITTIYASSCFVCHQYKVYPYEFVTVKGFCNDKGKCTTCMADISKRVKKYKNEDDKIDCPCGKCVYTTDLNRHNETLGHINGVVQVKIKGLNKICKIQEMRKIARENKIYNYQSLRMEVIITELLKLDVVVIPKEYQ